MTNMITEERASILVAWFRSGGIEGDDHSFGKAHIKAAEEAARREEQERCAKLFDGGELAGQWIARAIREDVV